MQVNYMCIMVTYLLVYHQDTKIIILNLKNIQHKNIIFKIDLFLMVNWVVNIVSISKNVTKLYSKEEGGSNIWSNFPKTYL